jgi:hypothetical protein
MAAVGIMLQLGLLHGCILCRRHCHCVAAVGVVLQSHLLCGCSGYRYATFWVVGAVIVWPRWASCHMAMVGVASYCYGGCRRTAFCVAGTIVA